MARRTPVIAETVEEEVLSPTSMPDSFYNQMYAWIYSGTQVIWLYTEGDEDRAERAIKEFAADPERTGSPAPRDQRFTVHTWDLIHGCTWVGLEPKEREATRDLHAALRAAKTNITTNSIIVARDLGHLLNAPNNVMLRRDLAEVCKHYELQSRNILCPIVIIANTPSPHPDIKDYVNVVDIPWPGKSQIRAAVVDYIVESARQTGGNVNGMTPLFMDRLAEALLGLTIEEGRKILGYAMAYTGINEQIFETISDQKALSIRKVEGLTYIPHRKIADATELGGFDAYLEFLEDKRATYTPIAHELGIERPRGVVLLGPPGTAKTTAAKISAKTLGLDLVIMDIAAMFKSLVGESERQIRAALNSIAAMNKVALMIDQLVALSR